MSAQPQLFQSPILLRDPEQTNHTQKITRWEGRVGVTIATYSSIHNWGIDQLCIKDTILNVWNELNYVEALFRRIYRRLRAFWSADTKLTVLMCTNSEYLLVILVTFFFEKLQTFKVNWNKLHLNLSFYWNLFLQMINNFWVNGELNQLWSGWTSDPIENPWQTPRLPFLLLPYNCAGKF